MKVGIADTTFARYDMGGLASQTVKELAHDAVRYTVPGFKDLPVAAKKLIEEDGCAIVITLAYSGKEAIDKQCAQEAGNGLIQAELMTNTHILKVFVYEDERESDDELKSLVKNRVVKHVHNAVALLKGKEGLQPLAGTGRRQGSKNAGVL